MFRNILVLIMAMFSFSFTLYAQDKIELCGETVCGTGEYCGVDESDAPACMCMKGYTLVNNACVINECVKADCPDNGYCTADYGFAECGCKEGYYLEKYKGTQYCLSNDTKNYDDIVLLNETECQSFGICRFRLDLQYPANMLNMNALTGYYFSVEEIEEKYEGIPFEGYLNECLKDGFCEEVSEQAVIFTMIFPTEGKRDINVSLSGMSRKSSVRQSITVEVNALADACYFKGCPEGSWCEVEGEYAYCRGNAKEDEGSLNQLMQVFEEPGGGGMALKGVVSNPQEQFWYKFNETAPGTSTCQNAPSIGGTFCGEWFIAFPPNPVGVYITPGSTGITRTTSAANFDYILSSVTVYVNITHPNIGDLVVTIISPNGTQKIVHNRAGGSTDDLSLAVNVTDFNNENPEGTWSLKVVDNYNNPAYTGRLTSWGVKLNSSGFKRIDDSSTFKRLGSYNGATYGTGQVGGYVGFDGTDDKITSLGTYKPSESLTFTGWVYPDSVTGGTRQIMHARKTDTERIRVMIYEGKVRAYVNGDYTISNSSVSASTWTHVAASFDTVYSGSTATGTNIKIYLNNELDKTDYLAGHVIDTTYDYTWLFGAYKYSSSYGLFFDGKFDEFRIFDSVLSRAQRDEVYDYGCTTGAYRRSNRVCYTNNSCGDGRISGTEQCEDRNTASCNSSCQFVAGFYPDWCFNSCENTYYQAYTQCGDEIVAGDEECDDGNTVVETCPVYDQSCTVCGSNCTNVAGIKEYCGDGIVQNDLPYPLEDEECDGVANCTNCQCDSGYFQHMGFQYYNITCQSVCLNVQCGPTGVCDNSTGVPICSCGSGFVARNNYCEEGWFEDENLAAEVIRVLQKKGHDIQIETDITASMLLEIENLIVSGMNIASLVGIENLVNLRSLNASANSFIKIDSLSYLENLVSLNLSDNDIQDMSPLSGLGIAALDISDTNIFNFSAVETLEDIEMIAVGTENGEKKPLFRDPNESVSDFFTSQGLGLCFYTKLIPVSGSSLYSNGIIVGTFSTVTKVTDCGSHGDCVNGECQCDSGYLPVNGYCYGGSSSNCESGESLLPIYNPHLNPSSFSVCFGSFGLYQCDKYKNDETKNSYPIAVTFTNGVPNLDGKTDTQCHYEDNSCNADSYCLFECAEGYELTLDSKNCVRSVATREISPESKKSLVYPKIGRNDIALEPVPGVPSFVPTYSFKWSEDDARKQTGYWSIDIPHVKFHYKNLAGGALVPYLLEENFYKATVLMPWGIEEYGVLNYDECFNANDEPCLCDSTNSSYEKWVMFPSPGQNIHGFLIIKRYDISPYWKVERYGEDGSETVFNLEYEIITNDNVRDHFYNNLIPIYSYKTRDNKTITYQYTRDENNQKIILKADITDPAGRTITIDTGEYDYKGGLFFFGHFNAVNENVPKNTTVSLNNEEIVNYYIRGQNNFEMTATIKYLRKDEYSFEYDQNTYLIRSKDLSNNFLEQEVSIKRSESGYKTYYNTHTDPYKAVLKKETLNFWSNISGSINAWVDQYFKRDFNIESSILKTIMFYEVDSISEVPVRKIVEKFSPWLQLIERTTCKTEPSSGNCYSEHTSVEKFGYNVNGAVAYHKSADNNSKIFLYDNNDVTAFNYNKVYAYGDITEKSKLKKSGKLVCQADYPRNAGTAPYDAYLNYVTSVDGSSITATPFCLNGSSPERRATGYSWNEIDSTRSLYDVWDLETITYPDERTKTFTYDYKISSSLPSGYTANGKVWGEILTGRNSQNSVETCYAYNNDYQLVAQGIGTAESCDYKKGFIFDYSDTGSTMIEDGAMWFNPNAGDGGMWEMQMSNKYIHDDLGRKIAEKNSAGVSTIYVYDSLDRVVFTFFGCNINDTIFPTYSSADAHFKPYDFSGSDSAGESGTGVTFSNGSGQFNYSGLATLTNCEYYRKYKYDSMSNLTYTYFFEYWDFSNHIVVKDTSDPKIIEQKTQYDLIGRPYKSCQKDNALSQERCIETEHDIFGNITKKSENGVERVVTYDYLNNPVEVKVNNLVVQKNEYESGTGKITAVSNKYNNPGGTTVKALFTYDNWNRVLKSEDPFQNEAEKSYNSITGWPDYSKSYNNSTLTSFDAYQYDDLGRVLKVQKALFDPADNTSNAGTTSIDAIASKEMTLEKLVTYHPDTGSVLTVEDSFGRRTEKYYDYLNRLIMVESYDANDLLVSVGRTAYDETGRIAATQSWSAAKTIVTEYGYDYMGRVLSTCSKTTDVGATFNCIAPASSCNFTDEKCSYKWYNTGGQVIWSADTETGETSTTNPEFNVAIGAFIGNETTYRYNAFGDVTHTVRRMTDDGDGGGLRELSNSYNSDGWIMTTYDYDSVGRLLKRSDDRGAETRYTYSADNLLVEEMYCPDSSCSESRTVNYTYDGKFDLLKEEYTQNSVTLAVNYFRDDFGRIKKKYTGETVDDVYQIFDYNERNLLMTAKSVDPISKTTVLSEVTRTYDSLGMIRSESFDSASDGSSTISSEIEWDPSTRVLSETIALPSGKNIVETNINGLTDNLKYNNVTLLKYNYGAGNALSSIYKNFAGTNHKIELNYSYTDWRKTDTRTEKFITPDPDEIIADYKYTYSKGLHLIGKQENKEDRREAYQYDSYYRLRRVDYDCDYNSNDPTCIGSRPNMFKCTSAEADCDDFQLDGVHNIRASYEDQTDYAWTVDGFNRLTQKSWNSGSNEINYSYDSNNNMVGEDHDKDGVSDVHYTYDKLNRLITFSSDDAAVSYSYDPFNRRTKKVVTYVEGSDTFERIHKYLYDGWNIVSEEIKTVCTSDDPDTVTEWKLNRYIDHGMDNHVMMETVDCDDDNGNCDPDETTVSKIWFHKDERGNVIAISDGEDTILERYRYRVYGEHEVINSCHTACDTTYQSCFDACNGDPTCEASCLATKNTCDSNCAATDYAGNIHNFLWGGSLYEPETDLYWMRNRYYHVGMHRFINQDPIGIWGDANNLGNGFAYVAGMVVEASDPTGLIRLKSSSVNANDLDASITSIFDKIDQALQEITGDPNAEAVITSANDGKEHGKEKPSLHYHNLAIDVRVNNLTKEHQKSFRDRLQNLLPKYFVYMHGKGSNIHIHIEYDPYDKGTNNGNTYWAMGKDPFYTPPSVLFGNNNSIKNPVNPNPKPDDKKKDPEKKPSEEEEKPDAPADSNNNDTLNPSTIVDWVGTPTQNADGSKTYTMANGDVVTVDANGIIIACTGDDCSKTPVGAVFTEKYPSDPYDGASDKLQNFLMQKLIEKMLKQGGGEQPPVFTDNSTGPNGATMFFRNPYYINKDPMKTLIIEGHSGRGFMFVRNPFAPKNGVIWANTYEMWQMRGIIQPEVDPWE